ncbi:DUF362 domain-containing protein [Oceanispirochaeta sp.]|uniref:DUF362 domain-containing protein n=1 Tax=Oceanispirochaeta sp. TaxID=2035350 RepID=UPI0026319637|nr:DUF362 domain-containing protein [Oceanispirochaeta sp.]MDA3958827.1 DUF362 domain-containing protein [Oceanispirochaeta sp.]
MIQDQIESIIQSTSFPDVFHKSVLLKPNMLSGSEPDKAVTTHPEFIRAVIRILKIRGAARIVVGDSPGVGSADIAGKKSGIKEVAEAEGAEWTVFREVTRVPCPSGKKQKQFSLASISQEVDIIISLPKMKTHKMMYFTGAVKNLFGLIPGLKKSRFHMNFPEKEDFASMIVDLFDTVRPAYSLMDGIVSMEGPGPGNGYPRQTGLILGSDNAAALDWTAADIMGYKVSSIPILHEIMNRGEWLSKEMTIEYPALHPDTLKIKDFKRIHILKDTGFFKKAVPAVVYNTLKNIYIPRPFFKASPCILCQNCIEICPADALTALKDNPGKKINIDYHSCIRCYCCHEVCPVDAIRIGRF